MSTSTELRGTDGEAVQLTLPVRRQLQLDTPVQPHRVAGGGGGGIADPDALPLTVLVKRIRYIFEQKQAEQLDRLPRMMDRNAGKEQVFYRNLMTKFSLDESFFPPELTLSRLALAERIQFIFERKAAENLDRLPQLMARNAGQEAVFYANMLRKYGLDESFFPPGQLPLEQLSAPVLKLRIEM